VTERFIDAFAERKQDKNLVDFSDLEHFALEILVEEEDRETNGDCKGISKCL